MTLRTLFDKVLAAEGLVVNLLRDFPSLRALRDDGRRLPGDIRSAWAMIDAIAKRGRR
jgi:hypothetical protein